MNIIVLRLPSAATKKELKKLIADLLSERLHIPFTPRPEISLCEILCFKDANDVVEYHGLITVHPDKAGEWLLNHFKGQHIHNKLVFAKEYVTRSPEGLDIAPMDDRRRKQTKVKKMEEPQVHTKALETFFHEHKG